MVLKMKDNDRVSNNLKRQSCCNLEVECQKCSSFQDCLDEYEFRRTEGLRQLPDLKPMCALCISVVMNQFGNYCLLDECRFHPDYYRQPIETLRKITANNSKKAKIS